MDYFKKIDGLQVNLSIYNYKVRNRTFTFVIEFLVVVRMVDYTCLLCPKGGGTSSIQIDGIGHAKRGYLLESMGETQLNLMRGIKAAFDPKGILNPGKVV